MASTLRLALLLLGALLVPTSHAMGQEPPSMGTGGEVGAIVSAGPTGSQVADHLMPMLGLGFHLRLTPGLEIGGDGFLSLRSVRISPDNSPDRAELALGYGGASIRFGLGGPSANSGWYAGLLAGAGTARIRSALVDAELDADNFFVIEPSLEYRIPLESRLGITAGVSYRFTAGADPLPGLDSGAIQGPALSLAIQAIRNP